MAFLPASIEVSVGERVVWQNTSTTVHNVVDDETKALNKVDVALPVSAKPFDSGFLQPGQSMHAFSTSRVYTGTCARCMKATE